MRTRDPHERRARRPGADRLRERCEPGGDQGLAAGLLHPRELYVGTLSGPQPELWRVALQGDRRTVLGRAPDSDEVGVVRRWAAHQLLCAALRYEASDAAVTALADELPLLTGPQLELTDLEVRLWFLAWRLRHRGAP